MFEIESFLCLNSGATSPKVADRVLFVKVLRRRQRGRVRAGRQQKAQTNQAGHIVKNH